MKLLILITAIFLAIIGLGAYFFRDTFSGEAPAAPTGLQHLASLPAEVSESSGLAVLAKGEYLTHNDAGNSPNLYRIDAQGKLQETIRLELPNVDWEDLAQDPEGNIYIADTGNNSNKRRELAVYRVNPEQPGQVQAIRFKYEDQKEFPPPKKDRNFDSEALFWSDGNLYIISKDRGRGQTAKVYQLPDEEGTYQARLIGSHPLKAQVTGAAISPDQETVALLSEGELHLFSDFGSVEKFYEGKYEKRPLKGTGQTEAVAFEDEGVLIITSEGGDLYRYTL
ncbi:hypothetical protein [Pontibacter flavimaris]|uniref:SMP-30/Gluconolactonase/LRE-like region domain-containing protein n=1 Tax=Pontibacter flavimaris TaxID=1797110 RepID=A0A1Q5PB37_9BACT|nr:hypothetical protein [Pontibacter flavimaris]OKL39391.1 hypothetical protein A3841_02150 [Pontibacter flavimaris]